MQYTPEEFRKMDQQICTVAILHMYM
ncbi:hypothetical protein [Bacillus arachidis]